MSATSPTLVLKTQPQLEDALYRDVLPVLRRLAADDALRERALRRFDNGPPPYASSREGENDEDALRYHEALRPTWAFIVERYQDVLDLPLNGEEEEEVIRAAMSRYRPRLDYTLEANAEANRLETFLRAHYRTHPDLIAYLELPAHRQRRDVIVRHLIRKR